MEMLITGIGMISAVGHDVSTTCASIRAGIVRPADIHHFSVMDEDTHQSEPLVGYPVSNLTDGFGSVGRWITMGKRAFNDLIDYSKLPNKEDIQFWEKTFIIFVTPTLDAAQYEFEGAVNLENVIDSYVSPFIEQINLPIKLQNCSVVSEDNIGVISAFTVASNQLEQADFDRVILIVADSYINAHSLIWLNDLGQLKLPNKPSGFIPGEAAAAILFESAGSVISRKAYQLAKITCYNTKIEKNNIFSEQANVGQALSSSLKELLGQLKLNAPFNGVIYTDLNGEEWRAKEYANALVNVSNSMLAPQVKEILPALSLGGIGVVNAACSLCMMIESKRRGYSETNNALVVASSPLGLVGSFAVETY